jgi:hypothetical protein
MAPLTPQEQTCQPSALQAEAADTAVLSSGHALSTRTLTQNPLEECRLLGYKHPVRTSQEIHYVFATKLRRLMLCKILGFHGRGYE